MVNEIESRLELDLARVEAVRTAVDTTAELSGIALRPGSRKIHTDTYFDNRDQLLYRRGWSLRIRESAGDFRLTLKGPAKQSGGVAERQEIESPRDGAMGDVLGQVTATMIAEGLLETIPPDLQRQLVRDGLAVTLGALGLRRIFDVETDRQTWIAVRTGEPELAEVALDKSRYKTALGEAIDEARLEIELIDSSRRLELLQMTRSLENDFGGREVTESKFERGVIHARSQGLQEKMEAKVMLASNEKYEEVARSLDTTSDLIRGYRFNRVDDNATIVDRYFDTAKHSLFERGWYLRHRKQGGVDKLTFRRLTEEARQGQVLQNEIVVDWSHPDTAGAWEAMWPWLQQAAPHRSNAPTLGSPDTLDALLEAAGFVPALDIEVVRTSWVVEKIPVDSVSTLRPIGERVTKLKYDRVKYSIPGKPQSAINAREFEVTGVEQHDASPTSLLRDSYQTFLALFVEQCAHLTGEDVEQRINAKYFSGLLVLGLVKSAPKWLTDGRLALRVSALRESDTGTPPASGGWSAARFWIALATLVAGLFALSSGSGEGVFGQVAGAGVFSSIVQVAGFLGILLASYYLFRRPYGSYSVKLRGAIVLVSLLMAGAILLPWAGRDRFADVVSLLGLVPLIVTMLRDGLGLGGDPAQQKSRY
ncbi:CYTH domain-containing protein [Kribbella ginsengisoli]|uniref:CYTH domain-containing protein n=1 Tax=Kribbella ginsengisoli TaxID=363865 RepID=A0ABP6X0N8_9ACTN